MTSPTPDAAPFEGSLLPFPTEKLPGLPSPHDSKVLLTRQLNDAVAKARKDRGKVTDPTETFALIRASTGLFELLLQYSKVFKDVATSGKEVVEEELFEAVGEQDGIPNSGMTVPHRDGGDIRIGVKTRNEYYFDMDQVIAALTALVASEWEQALAVGATDITPASEPHQFAISVALRALGLMGAATPKITQVKRIAHDLSADGHDNLARVVLNAVGKNRKFDGITVERKPAA